VVDCIVVVDIPAGVVRVVASDIPAGAAWVAVRVAAADIPAAGAAWVVVLVWRQSVLRIYRKMQLLVQAVLRIFDNTWCYPSFFSNTNDLIP
jgi:hypothetical protein